MTNLPRIPAAFGARRDAGRWLRRLGALAVLTTGVLQGLPAMAQEPPVLTGTWVGTWWIGKYEAPIELDLTQARQDLVSQVRVWAYPRADSSRATAIVRAPVTGTVEGHRVTLTWTMPEQSQFSVERTRLSQDKLFGLGGVGAVTTGFGLHRSR